MAIVGRLNGGYISLAVLIQYSTRLADNKKAPMVGLNCVTVG